MCTLVITLFPQAVAGKRASFRRWRIPLFCCKPLKASASSYSFTSCNCLWAGEGLKGSGTTNVEEIFSAWSTAYRYNRDTVSIAYESNSPLSSIAAYTQGQIDFACVDGVLPSSFLDTNPNLVLLPLVATALVPVYHLGASSNNLVLDGDTLARMWLGQISHWDDPAIVTLNHNLSLPHLEITLAYRKGTALGSQREVWNKAMSAFNSDFQAAINAVNGDLSLLIPTNRSFTSNSLGDRANFVNVCCYLFRDNCRNDFNNNITEHRRQRDLYDPARGSQKWNDSDDNEEPGWLTG